MGEISEHSSRKLTMRELLLSDEQMVLEWRNNEVTRQFSRNQALVTVGEHRQWMLSRCRPQVNESLSFIFLDGEKPIGLCRLDQIDPKIPEISILLDPSVWGMGYGNSILGMSLHEFSRKLEISGYLAIVSRTNIASKKLFIKHGFIEISSNEDFHKYQLDILP